MTSRPVGFTLIEVLVAAAILATMGGLVYGSFGQAYKQKTEIEASDERIAQARTCMDTMAREISMAFISDNFDPKRWRERPTFFRGEDHGREDELLFTSLARVRYEADSKTSDQAVITYSVDRDPEHNQYQSVFRRENPIIDEEADRRGTRAVLCENVRRLDFDYWDGRKNEWVEDWDTNKPDWQGVLPERVRIKLVIVDHNAKERMFTTQTRIMLQRAIKF